MNMETQLIKPKIQNSSEKPEPVLQKGEHKGVFQSEQVPNEAVLDVVYNAEGQITRVLGFNQVSMRFSKPLTKQAVEIASLDYKQSIDSMKSIQESANLKNRTKETNGIINKVVTETTALKQELVKEILLSTDRNSQQTVKKDLSELGLG